MICLASSILTSMHIYNRFAIVGIKSGKSLQIALFILLYENFHPPPPRSPAPPPFIWDLRVLDET